MPVSKEILDEVKQLIPPLNGKLHKGQSGRVGVLGGALEYVSPLFECQVLNLAFGSYTGAPFFASMSSQRLVSCTLIDVASPHSYLQGAELAHVICSPTAAGAIKSYSADLIVHPILREDSCVLSSLPTSLAHRQS